MTDALPPETDLGSLEQQGIRDRLDLSAARIEASRSPWPSSCAAAASSPR
jgi:hypothetical protein